MKITRRESISVGFKGKETKYFYLNGEEKGERVFGVEACVSNYRDGKYTVSFSSCNGDMEFMEKRLKVIMKAYQLARHLNKMKNNK